MSPRFRCWHQHQKHWHQHKLHNVINIRKMLSYVALKPSKPLLDKNKIPAVNRTGVVSVSVSAPPKKPKISQTSAVDSGNQNAPMRPRSARLKTQETPYPGSDSRTSSRAGRNATTSSNEKPKTKMSAITAAKLKDKAVKPIKVNWRKCQSKER